MIPFEDQETKTQINALKVQINNIISLEAFKN